MISEKEEKISTLLDIREIAIDLYNNVIYLQNLDIDNVRLLNACQAVINTLNEMIWEIEASSNAENEE